MVGHDPSVASELEQKMEKDLENGGRSFGLTTVATRMLMDPFDPPGSRSDGIAVLLGRAIRLGLIRNGDRLPPEPQLAAQCGVSTVTLREALATLREQGLVETRRGRTGGTFARSPLSEHAADLSRRLARWSAQDLRDLGDHRRAIAAAAAYLAAQRSLPAEIDGLRQSLERLRSAPTASERHRADTQLTIELTAASQSPRLTREEMRLRGEATDFLGLCHDDPDHTRSVRDLSEVVAAIADNDPTRAQEAAARHIGAVTTRMLQLRMAANAQHGVEPARHDGVGAPASS